MAISTERRIEQFESMFVSSAEILDFGKYAMTTSRRTRTVIPGGVRILDTDEDKWYVGDDAVVGGAVETVASGELYITGDPANPQDGDVKITERGIEAINSSGELVRSSISYPIKNIISTTQTAIQGGKRLDGSGLLKQDTGNPVASSPYVLLEAGATYCISGPVFDYWGAGPRAWLFPTGSSTQGTTSIVFTDVVDGLQFTVGEAETSLFLIVDLEVTENGGDIVTGLVQLEKGDVVTPHEGADESGRNIIANKKELLGDYSKNMINPSEIDYVNRYSTGSKMLIVDTAGIAASGYVKVVEGQNYTLSGAAYINWQGGYFKNAGDTAAVENITFNNYKIGGDGGTTGTFTVPTGINANYALVSLRKLDDLPASTELEGPVQLERRNYNTDIVEYEEEEKLRESYLIEDEEPSTLDPVAWLTYTGGSEKSTMLNEKAPVFRDHYLKRDKDLVVVSVGTSLSSRTDEHCTTKDDASSRPPMFHSNNMASIVWDSMKWDNQKYRRYDYDSFFTEGEAFETSYNESEWDDASARRGYTRFSGVTGASVGFQIPVDAFQFNFIYRTDSTGSTSNIVAISEGNGKVEVDNGATWEEANGYDFSMLEATPVTRVISIPNASTDVRADKTIASKGNTTYQKRLKMRCKSGVIDSRAEVKNVTVTGQVAGRFMYWGVEWSPREFMISYINSGRGGHDTQAETTLGLPRYQDNEVWSFEPDLMFFELPIHNDGAGNANAYAGGIWERLTNNYVFRADYELSMVARAATLSVTPEYIMYSSSLAWSFGVIDSDGELVITEQDDGQMMTGLDKFNQAYNWVLENHTNVGYINSVKRWVDAGNAIFGNLKDATEGSGKTGKSFTNEGGHWNDTGSKIIAKTLSGVFEVV